MKRIFIIALFVSWCSVMAIVSANDWQEFSSKSAKWSSVNPQYPIILKVSPADNNGCNVSGLYANYMVELKGTAWPQDGKIMLKIKGQADNGVNLMFYGEIKYLTPETILWSGSYSLDNNGRGVENEMSFYLQNAEAINEREKAEEEARIAKIKASPEYKLQMAFEELINTRRVGVKEQKSFNFGSALTSGIASAIDSNHIICVFDAEDEIKSCSLNQSQIQFNLKSKIINVDLVGRCDFRIESPASEVIAIYSADLSDVVYIVDYAGNKTVFLYSNNKLYPLNKKARKTILNN